jgi:hydrogenase expression/formation protein HypD
VGFETTSPAIAAAVLEARRKGLANFYLLSSQRLVPPALRALLTAGKAAIDGFILPGHVSVIIGRLPYLFVADEFGIPGVITGFEPLDILEGIYLLMRQKKEGRAAIEIQYSRAVKEQGNERACAIMEEVFAPADACWRGLGTIPQSGLVLREEFADVDAARVFALPYVEAGDPAGCLCGEVLQGLSRPPDCPLFGTRCTPMDPVWACMVSLEGNCAAYYKYGGFLEG